MVLFSVLWDGLAILLAGVFPGITWHGFRHTLEQAVSPASYPTHQQESGCAPSRMHVRTQRSMSTVTGIIEYQLQYIQIESLRQGAERDENPDDARP